MEIQWWDRIDVTSKLNEERARNFGTKRDVRIFDWDIICNKYGNPKGKRKRQLNKKPDYAGRESFHGQPFHAILISNTGEEEIASARGRGNACGNCCRAKCTF